MSLLFNGENIKKFRKWIVTAIMEKTVKNTGGVAALQKSVIT